MKSYILFSSLKTRNSSTGTLANNEGPYEIPHNSGSALLAKTKSSIFSLLFGVFIIRLLEIKIFKLARGKRAIVYLVYAAQQAGKLPKTGPI